MTVDAPTLCLIIDGSWYAVDLGRDGESRWVDLRKLGQVGKRNRYRVSLSASGHHRCTCPGGTRWARGGLCRHISALQSVRLAPLPASQRATA